MNNTGERLRIATDNSPSSYNTVAKLSTTAPSCRSCAAKRCSISISVSFSRSWVRLSWATEDTPLPWARSAEARPVFERPSPIAGARFERVAKDARLAPPCVAASASKIGQVIRLPDMAHNLTRYQTGKLAQ